MTTIDIGYNIMTESSEGTTTEPTEYCLLYTDDAADDLTHIELCVTHPT